MTGFRVTDPAEMKEKLAEQRRLDIEVFERAMGGATPEGCLRVYDDEHLIETWAYEEIRLNPYKISASLK